MAKVFLMARVREPKRMTQPAEQTHDLVSTVDLRGNDLCLSLHTTASHVNDSVRA